MMQTQRIILACYSGAQMGLIHEINKSKKYCHTTSLKYEIWEWVSYNYLVQHEKCQIWFPKYHFTQLQGCANLINPGTVHPLLYHLLNWKVRSGQAFSLNHLQGIFFIWILGFGPGQPGPYPGTCSPPLEALIDETGAHEMTANSCYPSSVKKNIM